MRVLSIAAVLVTGLLGCAPQDPVSYAQMVCADQDGLVPGGDEHAACVRFVAENPPDALLAIGGAMLGPLKAARDMRHDALSAHRYR
jgi:hypothetical protein